MGGGVGPCENSVTVGTGAGVADVVCDAVLAGGGGCRGDPVCTSAKSRA